MLLRNQLHHLILLFFAKLNKILKLFHLRNVSFHIVNTDENPGIQNFIASVKLRIFILYKGCNLIRKYPPPQKKVVILIIPKNIFWSSVKLLLEPFSNTLHYCDNHDHEEVGQSGKSLMPNDSRATPRRT